MKVKIKTAMRYIKMTDKVLKLVLKFLGGKGVSYLILSIRFSTENKKNAMKQVTLW
ncbi:hypothetical protein [Bacillus dicomae]|uniref:hypothetical protein n=1 Tax=Bacillus dicomae TaxID=3088378 RepID=UPI00142EC500|nr:hypothetical protein [Bacillus dicomae]